MGTNDFQILVKKIKKLKQSHKDYGLYNAGILDAIEIIEKYGETFTALKGS